MKNAIIYLYNHKINRVGVGGGGEGGWVVMGSLSLKKRQISTYQKKRKDKFLRFFNY